MENTKIQFFTEEQTRAVVEFTYNMYIEDRAERRTALQASDEFKKAKKELTGGKFDTILQKDKENLIAGFESHSKLHDALKETFGETGSDQLLELLQHPHWYLGGKDKDEITLPRIPSIETKELSSYAVRNYAKQGRSKDELIKEIDRRICEEKTNHLLHEQYRYPINPWAVKEQMRAIVATMAACDESQAVDKVLEKMPYDEVNKVAPKEVSECDQDAKVAEPVSSN